VRVTLAGRTGLHEAFGLDPTQFEQAQALHPHAEWLSIAQACRHSITLCRCARNDQTAKGSF
jgi:hypothetical protein